jgi:hypothetical protein
MDLPTRVDMHLRLLVYICKVLIINTSISLSMDELTKYKPGTRVQKSKTTTIIAMVAIAAVAAGIIVAAATGAIQPPTAPAGSDDNKPMVMHIHPMLSFVVDGRDIQVPKNIGIDNSLWNDHSLDSYGMQGMSPLHTHDTTGTIHVESNEERDFTLGEFLNIWGVLSDGQYADKQVKVMVDGNPVSDYGSLVLKDRQEIRLELS